MVILLGREIRKRRKELRITLDQLSDRVEFSKPYISTVETGKIKNPPSDGFLRKIEKALGFESCHLIKLAYLERMPIDIREHFIGNQSQNEHLKCLLKDLAVNKQSPDKFLNYLNSSDKPGKNVSGRLVPIINKVAAGFGVDFDDLEYPPGVADEYLTCPDIFDPNSFGVRISGDSMEPKFHNGEVVVFSPSAEVNSGDDCFVRLTDPHETTFKRVYYVSDGLIKLQPLNDKYQPKVVSPDRVTGIYRAVIRYEKL